MAKLFAKKGKLRHLCVVAQLLILSFSWQHLVQASSPKLALAQNYQKNEALERYWVSEKLDGVRAYWDGKHLVSKQGNRYIAPDWFTAGFPQQSLDGELWIKRGSFEQLVSTVRKMTPVDTEWRKVKYMLFDLPSSSGSFTARLEELSGLMTQHNIPHLQLIHQYKVASHNELQTKLELVTKAGGEGLMLHRGDSRYQTGRSSDILKVKAYQDAEALVIAHLPGKGKYEGLLGAVLVEMPNGKRFKIGSGFKDSDRKEPPVIGSQITYKYFGLTRKGLPKFASFLRVRKKL